MCIKVAAVHTQLCMNYIKPPQTYIIQVWTIGAILDLNEHSLRTFLSEFFSRLFHFLTQSGNNDLLTFSVLNEIGLDHHYFGVYNVHFI